MLPIPGVKNNFLVLLNKASLDLIRAVEREKMRQAFIKAVIKNSKKWEQVISCLKTKWNGRQAAFYRN